MVEMLGLLGVELVSSGVALLAYLHTYQHPLPSQQPVVQYYS